MVILERIFSIDSEALRLEVDQPKPDGDNYRCEFRIVLGDGVVREAYGMGVDSIQALILALQRAHIDLLAHRRDTGLPINWLEAYDLGLPLPSNVTAADFDSTD